VKRWKVVSSIAAGAVVVSAIVLYYSIPNSIHMNPCAPFAFQTANANAILAPATTKELYDSAEIVVVGRITDSTAQCEGSQLWTHMQIKVEESLKNPQGINVLMAKSYGGTMWDYGVWMEHSPIFEKGDRTFLYLYKDMPSDVEYRISPYSSMLSLNDSPAETISGKDILRSFDLQLVTIGDASAVDIPRGSNKVITISLESYFGYDSPTNVTVPSLTYYNSTNQDSISIENVTAFSEFGLSVEPTYAMITPPANGTAKTEFKISASDKATQGVYDITVYATEKDRYSYLSPGIGYVFVRVNVTEGV
jgi:hypothetical protein